MKVTHTEGAPLDLNVEQPPIPKPGQLLQFSKDAFVDGAIADGMLTMTTGAGDVKPIGEIQSGLKRYASVAELDAVREAEIGVIELDDLGELFPNQALDYPGSAIVSTTNIISLSGENLVGQVVSLMTGSDVAELGRYFYTSLGGWSSWTLTPKLPHAVLLDPSAPYTDIRVPYAWIGDGRYLTTAPTDTRLFAQHLYGTGFPEGVVAAPVGTIYTDTAATNGAIRWIKTAGTGATGWKVEYGETPLRVLTAGFPGSAITASRLNDTVIIDISAGVFTTTGDNLVIPDAIPAGFRPARTVLYGVVRDRSSGVLYPDSTALISSNGIIGISNPPAGTRLSIDFPDYRTRDPWPTILPGLPA